MNFGLSKEERISSVKAIEELIAKGRYANLGVIRCCYHIKADASASCTVDPIVTVNIADGASGSNGTLRSEASAPNRIMVSVPKKLFKRAVKRNLLKRRIREAYRLQKHALDGLSADIMFVYNTKEIADFQTIYAAVGKALEKIVQANGRR